MARKATKSQVVDVEVVADVEPVTQPQPAPKKRRNVKKEIQEETAPLPAPVYRLGDDGNFDISSLLPAEKKMYSDLVQRLDEHDMGSLTSYGADLHGAMNTYSTDFLKQRMNSDTTNEASKLMASLMTELRGVDVGDFEEMSTMRKIASKLPVIRHFVMTLDKFKAKYNTIEQNVNEIVKKLEATRMRSIRDNGLLEHQYNNNVSYIEQLGHLVIAGKIKSTEIEVEIEKLTNAPANYKTNQEISILQDYKEQLDKRIFDLQTLRYAFVQSLPQIRIIQKTNLTDANNTETQIAMTIPLWKNQLSLAVALYNQKQSLEIKNKVSETTNELMKQTSEMMKSQAVEIAKQNQRSVIDIDTLRKTTEDTVATLANVRKVYEEGAAQRAKNEDELKKLETQIYEATSGLQQSMQKVIAKELKNTEIE